MIRIRVPDLAIAGVSRRVRLEMTLASGALVTVEDYSGSARTVQKCKDVLAEMCKGAARYAELAEQKQEQAGGAPRLLN